MGWIMLTHHNNLRVRQLPAQAPGNIQTADARHTDIEENKVRLEFLRSLDCFCAVRGFAADFPAWLGRQDASYATSNDLAVISNENTQKTNLRYLNTGVIQR
jgi:hypothetical protein